MMKTVIIENPSMEVNQLLKDRKGFNCDVMETAKECYNNFFKKYPELIGKIFPVIGLLKVGEQKGDEYYLLDCPDIYFPIASLTEGYNEITMTLITTFCELPYEKNFS